MPKIYTKFLSIFIKLRNYIKFKGPYYNGILDIYGISQDPNTKEYILVMRYANNGSLRDYITKNFKNLKWKNKVEILYRIISGLKTIHQEQLVHHDFHSGNILHSDKILYRVLVADLGLSVLADQEPSSIVGVLPYIAPEVLSGRKPYTKKSDIYSFGILMSEISTGQQPFNNKAHDHGLMLKICEGLRPGFSNNTPKFYIELAYKCMDAGPDSRPTAEEMLETIAFWKDIEDIKKILKSNKPNYSKEQLDELRMMRKIFNQMDHIEYDPSTISVTMHPNAVYTSRILKSTNLPQPRNSNKVTIISNNYGNYLIYLIQHKHYYCIYYNFIFIISKSNITVFMNFFYNFFG